MSSDVFIISSARNPQGPAALQQAVELAGLLPAQVQDVVFGLEGAVSAAALEMMARAAGLACPVASVSPGLRAIFFAAASLLSEDAQLALAAGLYHEAASAFLLASPEAVGRLNLLPRARIAACSLDGRERAFRQAGVVAADVEICKEGGPAFLVLGDLLDELESGAARWGLLSEGSLALLVERV